MEYPASLFAVILVPVEGIISTVVPVDGSTYIQFVDIPFEEVVQTVITEENAADKSSGTKIRMIIHLAQGSPRTVFVNGRGYSLPSVSLSFDHLHTANNLQDSIIGQRELVERQRPLRLSYAPPQDISEKDSGISVGPDDYSTAAECEDLVKVAKEAEKLAVQVHPQNFGTSQIGRKASIQSPICANLEPGIDDLTSLHDGQHLGSGKDLEPLVQYTTSNTTLNDVTHPTEKEPENQGTKVALSLSEFLAQVLEEGKEIPQKSEVQSTVSDMMIKQNSTRTAKVCRRMRDRQGDQAKIAASEENSQEMEPNNKTSTRSHEAPQTNSNESTARIDKKYRSKYVKRWISSSDNVGSLVNVGRDIFDIPDSSMEALNTRTRPKANKRVTGNSGSILQRLRLKRKAEQHHISEPQVQGGNKQSTDVTNLNKLNLKSNPLGFVDHSRTCISATDDSDTIILAPRLNAKGVSSIYSTKQRPNGNMNGVRKKSTRQRKPVPTTLSRPSTKRRAAVQANMKIRGVVLNENAPSQEVPPQSIILEESNGIDSGAALDTNQELNAVILSPNEVTGSCETRPELFGSQERLKHQPSTPTNIPMRRTSVEIGAADQPLTSAIDGTVDLQKHLTECSKGPEDQYHEYPVIDVPVTRNEDTSQVPLERAISSESLDRQAVREINELSANRSKTISSEGVAMKLDLHARERPSSIANGDVLKFSETVPEHHESIPEGAANHHFEDAMAFVNIEDPSVFLQPWQYSNQEEVALKTPQKHLLRQADYATTVQPSVSVARLRSEMNCESAIDTNSMYPFASRIRGASSANGAGIESSSRTQFQQDIADIEQGRIAHGSRARRSKVDVLKQDGCKVLEHEHVSRPFNTSRQKTTSPVIQHAPEAVMVSLDIMAERDKVVGAQMAAKPRLTDVIDISSDEEVDDDSFDTSEVEVQKQPETPVSKITCKGKHRLEETDCRTSKRLKSSIPTTSPIKIISKDLGEFPPLVTSDYALRKSNIISFNAKGPRNQGIISTQSSRKNHLKSKDSPEVNAVKTDVSKSKKRKSSITSDHLGILPSTKRLKSQRASKPFTSHFQDYTMDFPKLSPSQFLAPVPVPAPAPAPASVFSQASQASQASSALPALQANIPHSHFQIPAPSTPPSDSPIPDYPRLPIKQAVASHGQSRAMKGKRINSRGSPVPEGHISCKLNFTNIT